MPNDETPGQFFGLDYPRKIPRALPPGKVLVHNGVTPARRQGERGFRFWIQDPHDGLETCECGWGPEAVGHYIPGGLKWNDIT